MAKRTIRCRSWSCSPCWPFGWLTASGTLGKRIEYTFDGRQPGDQSVFIYDLRHVKEDLGWEPKVGPEEGVELLYHWVLGNRRLFERR